MNTNVWLFPLCWLIFSIYWLLCAHDTYLLENHTLSAILLFIVWTYLTAIAIWSYDKILIENRLGITAKDDRL